MVAMLETELETSVFSKCKLGEIAKIYSGYAFKSSDLCAEGIPVLKIANIQDRKVLKKCESSLPKSLYTEKLKKYLLHQDDFLIAMTGAGSVGKVGKMNTVDKQYLVNQRVAIIRVDSNLANPNYVFQAFATPYNEDRMYSIAFGAGQPNLSSSDIGNLDLPLPVREIQDKIASILSSYDDLIENNNKRIAILEAVAQALYREWFVHFRYPGHEHVPLVDSSLGPIPQGWEVKRLEEVCAYISRGLSPKYDEQAECIILNQKCIRNGKINFEPARRQSKTVPIDKVIKFGDVLINSTGVGTLGRVAQVYDEYENCTADSHVSIVRPSKDLDIDYFGMTLLDFEEHFTNLGVGSTGQTELSRGSIQATEVLIPDVALQEVFSNAVAPMRKLCLRLDNRNKNLRQTRDLLLPRLISGQLDVSELEVAGV